jgi:hypothetical protein
VIPSGDHRGPRGPPRLLIKDYLRGLNPLHHWRSEGFERTFCPKNVLQTTFLPFFTKKHRFQLEKEFVVSCLIKSSQFNLHIQLPDAMSQVAPVHRSTIQKTSPIYIVHIYTYCTTYKDYISCESGDSQTMTHSVCHKNSSRRFP